VHPRVKDWQVARISKFRQLTNTSQEYGWFFCEFEKSVRHKLKVPGKKAKKCQDRQEFL